MPGINIAHYAHQDIDRFGVMQDLWSNEVAFMECKREVRIFSFPFTLILLAWMKVFSIIPVFWILRLTFHGKSASKC